MACCCQTKGSREGSKPQARYPAEYTNSYWTPHNRKDELELVDVGCSWEDGLMQHQLGQSAPQPPDVYRLVIVFAAVNNLGSPVISRCHIACFLLLLLRYHHGFSLFAPSPSRDAEIAHFDHSGRSKIDVAGFDIPMHVSSFMDVIEAFHNLEDDVFEQLEGEGDFLVPE